VRMRCIPFVQSQCKGCGRAHISVYCFLDESYARLYPCTPLSVSVSVPWRGMKEKVCATEVRVCDNLINRIQATVADIVSGQLFFVRG
jgi:hypothetical protein